ncbi:MAG: cysteine-rich CWC family protein [Tissierellia bacterium]|nr:cysteine-rich CWC family protein [Tissierellia bacterium]
MELKEHEKICPICGQPNNCQHGQEYCWCVTAKTPKEIFDLVPEDKRGKVCICRSCIEKYGGVVD